MNDQFQFSRQAEMSDDNKSQKGEEANQDVTHDAVFGEINEDGPNYRGVCIAWLASERVLFADFLQVGGLGSTALMLKTNLGLGVLSIPAVFDTLGMIPGIICVLAMAMITGWSQYMIGVFKKIHPEVYGIEDVAGMIFGNVAREIVGAAFFLCEYSHMIDHVDEFRSDQFI